MTERTREAARKAYNEVEEPARKAYEEAIEAAWKAYESAKGERSPNARQAEAPH